MTIYSAAVTLILVMDPFGNIPVFLSVLKQVNPKRRKIIILREMVIAFTILVLFLFFGKYILAGLHISEPALGISGGVILFLIAIKMIFPSDIQQAEIPLKEEPVIVPLAVPMVAGPSSMAMVILLSTQYPEQMWQWLLALSIAWGAACCVLMLSDSIRKVLGNRALRAIERLMGMILTTMSVQMLLSGLKTFFGQ